LPRRTTWRQRGLADVTDSGGGIVLNATLDNNYLISQRIMDFISELSWRPEIGDPTITGWFTVAAYAIGSALAALAALAAMAYRQESDTDHEPPRQSGKTWFAVTILMAGLCINKQLDLQSLFTDIGRIIARHQDWYEHRRYFQKWFVLGAVSGSAALTCWVMWRYRAFCRDHKLLIAGLSFLLTFIVVRAISFHHVEEMIDSDVLGYKLNWILELTGIFIVSLAAVRERSARLLLCSQLRQ
jgi:hypothetical protein